VTAAAAAHAIRASRIGLAEHRTEYQVLALQKWQMLQD
jgi:hypothetical protein